ncbi:MAG TPA: hypothetical protein ACQGQH_03765 [Xylella sp.]
MDGMTHGTWIQKEGVQHGCSLKRFIKSEWQVRFVYRIQTDDDMRVAAVMGVSRKDELLPVALAYTF